jgi:hypothetical protein
MIKYNEEIKNEIGFFIDAQRAIEQKNPEFEYNGFIASIFCNEETYNIFLNMCSRHISQEIKKLAGKIINPPVE